MESDFEWEDWIRLVEEWEKEATDLGEVTGLELDKVGVEEERELEEVETEKIVELESKKKEVGVSMNKSLILEKGIVWEPLGVSVITPSEAENSNFAPLDVKRLTERRLTLKSGT